LGKGFGYLLIILGAWSVFRGNVVGGIWWFLIGMFVRNASDVSYRQVLYRRALEQERGRFISVAADVPADAPSLEDGERERYTV
jgi:hypothetical protein